MKTKWILCNKKDFERSLICNVSSEGYEFYNLDYLATVCNYNGDIKRSSLPIYSSGSEDLSVPEKVNVNYTNISILCEFGRKYDFPYSKRPKVNNLFHTDIYYLIGRLKTKLNNFNGFTRGRVVMNKESRNYVFIRYIVLKIILQRISKVKIK